MAIVSIIMPAYNAENSIKASINSVLNQSYTNIELIIVNDGSSDDTKKIVNEMQLLDSRIRLINIDNNGVSNARNVGINESKGEYIAFIDSDDTVQSDFIEQMISHYADNVDLVCCGYNVVSLEEKIFSLKPISKLYDNEFLYDGISNLQNEKSFNVLWNKLFRRDLIVNHNIKMEKDVRMGEDLLFVIEYFNCMTGGLKCIPLALYNYKLNGAGAQATQNSDDNFKRRFEQLDKLKTFYLKKEYPLNTFYLEQFRCIYLSLKESGNVKKLVRYLNSDFRYREMISNFKPIQVKDYVFFMLLKHRLYVTLSITINLFQLIKKIQGKSFSWK